MSLEQLTPNARANMYTGVSSTSGSPPIPPRESSIPIKAIKTAPPEVKKKRAKKTDSSRTKDITSKVEKESPLVVGFIKETQMEEISGSRER